MILKTTGLILRAIKFRESDLILTVLSRDYGKIALIAKAARRTDSKFGAALDLLTLSELVFYEAENLKLLKEASIIEEFRAIKSDYDRVSIALRTAHLLNQLLEDDHPDAPVFDLLRDFLVQLSAMKNIESGELAFKLKLLRALGVVPRMSSCTRGGHKLTDEFWFSSQSGGFVCANCHQAGDTRLEPSLAQSLKMLLGLGWEKLDRLVIERDQIKLAHQLLDEFVGFHLKVTRK